MRSINNFDIHKAVMKNVGDIENLDLIPSSLDLVVIQDRIIEIASKSFVSHVEVLKGALIPVIPDYDYILIDCPPNVGAISLNGILISDYYVIPTTPDILSKIGISLITNRMEYFKNFRTDCRIKLGGIVFTKVDNRSNLHMSTLLEMRNKSYSWNDYVFENELPVRISIAEAPIDNKPHLTSPTAKTKTDWNNTQDILRSITNEFIIKTA